MKGGVTSWCPSRRVGCGVCAETFNDVLSRMLLGAEDALADVVLGGGGGDVLRGAKGSERLVGFGGEGAHRRRAALWR